MIKIIKASAEEKQALQYFMRYAFPCAFIKLQQGKMSELVYKKMHKAALGKIQPDREMVEKYFILASGHIKSIARDKGVADWSTEAVREYFWKCHDDVIEAGEGYYANAPEFLCELCRVRKGKIVKLEGNGAVVKFAGGKRSVLTELVPDLTIGDKVMIHYGYVVEKL